MGIQLTTALTIRQIATDHPLDRVAVVLHVTHWTLSLWAELFGWDHRRT
ncbi:hypothetical protein EDC27_1877 [Desulfosoma caldarium]|uniref:Uncharacterized protein n=1 Tax=Desulfosoma caldarium TaxID=610254 RepID=A0A3N1UY45_9BACT|nr:hypothetical protein EDC27_1877 [Desulfosoma caldarium]